MFGRFEHRVIACRICSRVDADFVTTSTGFAPAGYTAADAKGIRLERLIDPSDRVAGDSTRLQQVVSNLLTNAVKFSDHGERVLLRVVTEGSHAAISVRDMGEGIAADFLPHIFERFYRADRRQPLKTNPFRP
jgi:signal transduction histidine kinase